MGCELDVCRQIRPTYFGSTQLCWRRQRTWHDRRPGCCWSPRPWCSSRPGRPGPASRPDQVLCRVAFARLIFTHSRNPQGLLCGAGITAKPTLENHLPQMILPPKIVCRADDLTCRTLVNLGGCLLCRTSCSDGRSPRGVSPGPETKNSNVVVASRDFATARRAAGRGRGRQPFWATNAYVSGISGPSGKGMEGGTSTPGGRSGPGGLEGRVGAGDGDVGSACAMPIPCPTALKPRPPDTTAMATSCLSFSAHLLVSFALALA